MGAYDQPMSLSHSGSSMRMENSVTTAPIRTDCYDLKHYWNSVGLLGVLHAFQHIEEAVPKYP